MSQLQGDFFAGQSLGDWTEDPFQDMPHAIFWAVKSRKYFPNLRLSCPLTFRGANWAALAARVG